MKHAWSRRLHGLSRALGWVVGVTLITVAVAAALAQVLLPLLARHPQWVAEQLGQRLHRSVSFKAMTGRWTPSGPEFTLRGVTLGPAAGAGSKDTALAIPAAELQLDFGGWLLPSRHLINLHARGLQLNLSRAVDGRWQVSGFGVAGGDTSSSLSLQNLSMDLWLDDLHIDVADERTGRHYPLLAEQLRVGLGSGEVRLGARLRRPGANGVVTAAGNFRDDGAAGRVWLAGDDLDVKAMLGDVMLAGYTAESGRGHLAAWLDWRGGKVVQSLLQVDLSGVSLRGPGGGRAQVARIDGLADIRQTVDGYAVRWAGSDGSALVAALHRPAPGRLQVGVAASRLQLAPLLPWLALKPNLSPALAQWLGAGKPHGELNHATLQWSRADGIAALTVNFSDVGIDPVGDLPGVDHLEGTLRGDASAISVRLPAQATVLRFPHAFRQPFALAQLDGTLAAWHEDQAWHIGIDPLNVVGTGFVAEARGEMALPDGGGRPFLDLYARVDHADVAAAKLFWPTASMSPTAIAWLDRALVGGRVDSGAVLVHGNLADWPFRHNEGRFEAQATLSDLTFDYGEDWPRAEKIHAVARFVGNGMLVQASSGQSLGVNLTRAVALIPDFHDGILDLNVAGSGSGASLMSFVRKSPIGMHEADTLAKLKLGGSGDFNFHLSLPLKPGSELQLAGSGQLKDADLSAPAWNLQLDKLNGPLQFDVHGLSAGPLHAGFRGEPSQLQMRIAAATGDPDQILSARLDGNYTMAELVQGQPAIAWLGQVSQGRSAFRIGFDIAREAAGAPLQQMLTIDSTLQGTALSLPAPLDKLAAGALPLHVSLPLPVASADLQVSVGQLLRGRFRLPGANGEPLGATLQLGTEMPSALPVKGLRVRGHSAKMDVTGWIQHTMAGADSPGAPTLESIDVSADQASVFGNDFPDFRLQAKPQPDALSVDVDSPAMAGHFQVPSSNLSKRGITARLKRLYWPKAGSTVHSGGKFASDAGPTPAQAARTGINPASLPPLHLLVDELRLGDAKLGQARLESWPTDRGMHIDQLRALSRSVQITASGDWDGTPEDSQTHLRIDFAAEDLGQMLSALGFDGLFDGGKTRAHLDGRWPGAPSALTLANLDGKLDVNVTDGRIPDASSPGVGRLLGLVSLAELPRRLTLDFGDVFGKGLGFDSITGNFAFADGEATTDNLKIKGPAAEITVTGRTGLRARDYDQQVLVVPHVGNSLPVVGAVVGGPVGAAAGLAMQGILGKGLNKAASARYKVTGSWDKPVMTLMEKHAAPRPKPPAVPKPRVTAPAPAASAGG